MFKKILIAVVLCLFVATLAFAQQRGTPAEAKAMVEKAVAYIKANGQEKAFAEINNTKGKFVDRDLYVTVYDLKGTCLAHGAIPEYVGKNFITSKDPDGTFFIKERIEAAQTKGSGWQNYKFIDPLTKKVEPKTYYFERVGNIVVGCGAYKPGS
jgi:cytochrome c